ncbi:GTP cyclohydrolase II [Nisaea acidiphila]|uniref:GTP cyclohydrolase-2 n=1 Tax=Nisaea acidiphila TaxID=1862145 RepID=A0A9J7ARM0_9PROT|nr:GTP cyclohydrolase II [Nisaea acidiphila]UUX47957.1 GTP cyclohydrolase II [Nisaea acidiphila]
MEDTQPLAGGKAAASTQTSVDRAISELRRGGLVLLHGSADESVLLVLAAEMANEVALAAMVRLAGSLPSVIVPKNRARDITGNETIPPYSSMALPHGVDAALVRQIADPLFEPEKLGTLRQSLTIVPVRAGRLGPASVQLSKWARLLPSVVVARVSDVKAAEAARWAHASGLLSLSASDVEGYVEASARRLSRVATARVPLADAENSRIVAFRPADGGEEHLAIIVGDPDLEAPVLVRLHSECLTGDLLGSLRCDCGDQLRGALKEIGSQGSGILLYLAQEGRDIGLINKLRAYQLQDLGSDTVDANEQLGFEADERVYLTAAEMLRQLGVRSVRLMTNNPEKISQLRNSGVDVVERVAHIFPSNSHNEGYLRTKASRTGHLF